MKLGVTQSLYKAMLVNITFSGPAVHHGCRITETVFSLGGGRGDGDCRRQGWPQRECRVASGALSRQHLSVKKQHARLAVAGREGEGGGRWWRRVQLFHVLSQDWFYGVLGADHRNLQGASDPGADCESCRHFLSFRLWSASRVCNCAEDCGDPCVCETSL